MSARVAFRGLYLDVLGGYVEACEILILATRIAPEANWSVRRCPPFSRHNAYGKSQVRLTRVTRHADRHDLKELCVGVQLEGDFADSYLARRQQPRSWPTDTIKNTVYILAKKHGVAAVESFGETLARHFLRTYATLRTATIHLGSSRGSAWRSMAEEHPHAFVGGGDGSERAR